MDRRVRVSPKISELQSPQKLFFKYKIPSTKESSKVMKRRLLLDQPSEKSAISFFFNINIHFVVWVTDNKAQLL